MEKLFDNIQELENQKWNLLEDQTTNVIYEKMGTSRKAIFDFIDTKK